MLCICNANCNSQLINDRVQGSSSEQEENDSFPLFEMKMQLIQINYSKLMNLN